MNGDTSNNTVIALIAAVIIGGGFYVYGKNMELRAPVTSPLTISVSADGKVSTPPDIATLSFGVATGRQATAKAAIDNVNKSMAKILDAVKKAGIPEKDISTQSFWLNPVYDYNNGMQVPRGFEANQSLSVKVRDLDKVGEVLTAATDAGANQAGGVNFSIDNPDAAQAEARELAIDAAEKKARDLAKSLGMSLGRMTGFNEGGGYAPSPMYMKSEAYDAMGGATRDVANQVQLPAGEQEVTSYVTLTYELR